MYQFLLSFFIYICMHVCVDTHCIGGWGVSAIWISFRLIVSACGYASQHEFGATESINAYRYASPFSIQPHLGTLVSYYYFSHMLGHELVRLSACEFATWFIH